MVLVNSLNHSCRIDDPGTRMARMPYEPVVPARAADDKGRRILVIETSRESEIVDPLGRPSMIRLERLTSHGSFPVEGVKIHRRGDVCVPALPGHQKPATERYNAFRRNTKI